VLGSSGPARGVVAFAKSGRMIAEGHRRLPLRGMFGIRKALALRGEVGLERTAERYGAYLRQPPSALARFDRIDTLQSLLPAIRSLPSGVCQLEEMLYQHSFWYRASQKVFEDALKADPECGIAYWGIALSLLLNPHIQTSAKILAEGAAAMAKGKNVGAKTQRERDYIATRSRSCTPTSTRSITAPGLSPTPRPWNSWRSVIQTMTKRKSTTHLPSTAQCAGQVRGCDEGHERRCRCRG
jgi:hypothetical protein